MKLKHYHFVLVALVLTIISCKKDGSNNSNVTNTLTIKTANGDNLTLKYNPAPAEIANTFRVILAQGGGLQGMTLLIYKDIQNHGTLGVFAAPSLGVGTYTTTTDVNEPVLFIYRTTAWMPQVNYTSVTLTRYDPHGRITGTATSKDQSGNVVETASFDFTVTSFDFTVI